MLNNMKISTRLMFLLALLLALLMVVGGIGLLGMSKANEGLHSVYKDRMEPSNMVGRIMLLMNENRAQVMLALQHNPENPFSKRHDHPLALHTDSIIKNRDEITDIVAEYKKRNLSPEERALADKYAEARAQYVKEGLVAAREAVLAGDFNKANEILLQKINPYYKTANAAADELLQQTLNTAKADYDAAITRYAMFRNFAIALIMLGMVLGGALGLSIIRGINRSVNELCGVMVQMSSEGNLNTRARVYGQEEIGQASTALNMLIERFSGIMREIEDCSRNMGQSSYQIAAISNEISEVNKQQENHSGEVIGAMRQMHQISSNVQAQAVEAAGRSRQVEILARDGIENVHQNISSMEETTRQVGRASLEIQELEQSAQQIHNIVKTIKEIAGQTNLLALNAAIEAARAGEQGRGFAVVADEVRKLAERTTHSATEVSDIIGKLSGKVQQVAATMNVVVQKVNVTQEEAGKTASAIEEMAGNAVETAQANQGISGASQQQLEQFGLLQSTLETLFSILKESGAKVDITAAIGDDLRAVAGRLNGIMSGFTFATGAVIEPAQHENRRAPRAQNSLRVKMLQGGQTIEAVSSDFSMTGMCLRLPNSVNEGNHVDLSISLPIDLSIYQPNENLNQYEHQKPLHIKGRILRQRKDANGYVCGVEFVNVDEGKRSMIKKCFAFFHKNAEF